MAGFTPTYQSSDASELEALTAAMTTFSLHVSGVTTEPFDVLVRDGKHLGTIVEPLHDGETMPKLIYDGAPNTAERKIIRLRVEERQGHVAVGLDGKNYIVYHIHQAQQ